MTIFNFNFNLILVPLAIGLGIAIVILVIFVLVKKKITLKKAVSRSLNMTLFLITLPKETKQEQKTEKEIISVMEQLYATLSEVSGRVHLALEIALPAIGQEISFYLACSRKSTEIIEKQIHGFFPQANVEPVSDYNIFNPQGYSVGSYLFLKKTQVLPIRTYQELETDPLGEITTALSKLEEMGEGAALQILIKPAPSKWRSRGLKIAQKMQEGLSLTKAQTEVRGGLVKEVRKSFQTKPKKKQEELRPSEPIRLTPLQEKTIKSLEDKAGKVAFQTNIRLLASAATAERSEQILSHLEGAFRQFSSPEFNSFKSHHLTGRALKKLIYNFSFRLFNKKQSAILNTEELTSIYHFPISTIQTPKIKALKAKPASPPANMPKEGLVLGKNVYRGEQTTVKIALDDRRRHIYIIGQTGTGKSSFLSEMIRQDIESGQGVAVIDPHGDLVEKILTNVPQNRAEDVIYFNPADTERPMGLNMLEWKTPEQKDFAVQEMIAIFYKLFPPEMIGPMFEHNMRNAMLTLMAVQENPGTICEIPRIFTDETFAKYKLERVTDAMIRAFWEKEMAKTTEYHKSEMLGYLISKVGRFVENAMMRNIIGQSHSGFDFRQIMDQGKILLVNLSKGQVGEINSNLLGLIIVAKLQMASMARGEIPEEQRKDFYLYIDEFQNFTTDSISNILSEARKYRLCLTLAHQFIGQLPENIKNAVFGNVGTMVSFRLGPEDAEFVIKQYEPVFNTNDLINLDNFNAYVKLMIAGTTTTPFNMTTYPPKEGNIEMAKNIQELCRFKYGRDRAEVEKEILERSKLGSTTTVEQSFVPGEKNR